ncbi:nitrogen fixation protein NifZ [Blastopirellula sp. JC732]|uniref:Nitrogen fixation protein NifZ n=1 Tax=Blastopirellula sediminis TaxID=2894196 RepID=A0A9X1MJ54_9BACT|nr:nitrogen fixation protein NifZ [Blastopirellula sediminis]MCC9608057.1 nitrogen fixation protein NifZ [Blastopirellula sediminis]MCC9627150.1 nitrogen fixation protein NifZ [Blastopirellula sediminis]
MIELDLKNGDAVFAKVEIRNDGSIPHVEKDALLAEPGMMGMLINTGHLEEATDQKLLLISFVGKDGEMGPLVTCFAEEISTEPLK